VDYYHKAVMPVMAEWAFLWLQKAHLHGIDKGEAIRYMLEGAAAKSDTSSKIKIIDTALDKALVTLGERLPGESQTPKFLRSVSETEHQEQQKTLKDVKAKVQIGDQGVLTLIKEQAKELQTAKDISVEFRNIVNEIYSIDEQIEAHSVSRGRRQAELQSAILAIVKQVASLENPRDDSLDNSVVLWCSQAFSAAANAGAAVDDTSVVSICSQLEDAGLNIHKCCDSDEAILKARELQRDSHLRCVIIGGEERAPSCGPTCVKVHYEGNCLKCKQSCYNHNGHECYGGGRGTWAIEVKETDVRIDPVYIIRTLTDEESTYARTNKPLPNTRAAVYAAHAPVKEDQRLVYWDLGTAVTDEGKSLLSYVNSQPAWAETRQDGSVSGPQTTAQQSVKEMIAQLRQEIADLEAQKVSLGEADETQHKSLQQMAAERDAALEAAVLKRVQVLTAISKDMKEILLAGKFVEPKDETPTWIGPHSGRDSALAIAWFNVYKSKIKNDMTMLSQLYVHQRHVENELSFLRQMSLAAKVVALVTSPLHKKLLNLCHNWLSTFLPHCLAKVNRVSFGLLSPDDIKAALETDPHVPRSRLKLAVPFMGKDVPSKSSEFAHPGLL
jgi:hypothetical protein